MWTTSVAAHAACNDIGSDDEPANNLAARRVRSILPGIKSLSGTSDFVADSAFAVRLSTTDRTFCVKSVIVAFTV